MFRSIDAISIFGCGFGELIRPSDPKGLCPNWQMVPTMRYYLGASVFDLHEIFDSLSVGRASHAFNQPVEGLLWHCPGDAPTASCQQCQRENESGRGKGKEVEHEHDPVQVFYPSWSRRLGNVNGPGNLMANCGDGAVIFGHNFNWPFYWSEKGEVELERLENKAYLGTPIPEHTSNKFQNTRSRAEPSVSQFRDSWWSIRRRLSRLSSTGQSSHSSGRIEGATMDSSISGNSSYSTPQESVPDEAQASAGSERDRAIDTALRNRGTTRPKPTRGSRHGKKRS